MDIYCKKILLTSSDTNASHKYSNMKRRKLVRQLRLKPWTKLYTHLFSGSDVALSNTVSASVKFSSMVHMTPYMSILEKGKVFGRKTNTPSIGEHLAKVTTAKLQENRFAQPCSVHTMYLARTLNNIPFKIILINCDSSSEAFFGLCILPSQQMKRPVVKPVLRVLFIFWQSFLKRGRLQ